MKSDVSSLRDVFYANLEAQGASPCDFVYMSETTLRSHVDTLYAESDGFVNYPIAEIRRIVVDAQHIAAGGTDFADPVGLVLLRRPGEWVRRGEPIATLRIDRANREEVATAFQSLILIQAYPAGPGFGAVKSNG